MNEVRHASILLDAVTRFSSINEIRHASILFGNKTSPPNQPLLLCDSYIGRALEGNAPMKRQISFDGMLTQTELVQFDDTAVYIGRGDAPRVVPFAHILSLAKTGTKINNRYFWELAFHTAETTEKRWIQFRPNNTLWNRNFWQFHALLSEVNPQAIKTPHRWWYV